MTQNSRARLVRATATTAILLIATLLAGCAVGTPAPVKKAPPLKAHVVNGSVYLPPAMATREYRTEAGQLALSPGTAWPSRPLVLVKAGEPLYYERGFGRQAADFYWFCSWARVATATGDPVARAQALLLLPEIERLPYFTATLNRVGRAYLARAVRHAEHGSLRALRRQITLNCPASVRSQT